MNREPPTSEELTVEKIRECVIGSIDNLADGLMRRDFAMAKWGVDRLLAMLDALIGETEKKRLSERWDAMWSDHSTFEWFLSLAARRNKERPS